VAAVAAGVLVLSGVPAHLGLGWISALGVPEIGRVHLAIVPMLAALIASWADALGADSVASVFSSAHALTAASVLALVAATAVLLRWRTGPSPRVVVGAAVALVAATLLSPVVHYWYFLWCVPLLCAVRLTRAWAAAVVAEVLALGLTAVCDPAYGIAWMSALGGIGVLGAPLVAFLAARQRTDVAQIAPTERLSDIVTDE
jgi:alpha-1,6-mannosyltransferase